jgi:opacity protein-like surface antigen
LKRYFVFLLCGLFLFPTIIFAKDESDTLGLRKSRSLSLPKPLLVYNNNTAVGNNNYIGLLDTDFKVSKPKKTWFKNMRYSGYARLFILHRNMQQYYDIPPTQGLTLPVNLTVGDGYQQPLMLIRMEGSPSAKTAFNMELQFDHRLLTKAVAAPVISDSLGRYANIYVIFKLTGEVDTRFGKFSLTAGGGANWMRLSPFTLWGYQYRDDLFDRYPWEPEGHDFSRYNSSYAIGDIPRDQRFGMQATQGFILENQNLPGGFEAKVLYGKTQSGGGFQSYLTRTPQNVFATRLAKKLGSHTIGYNYFNQYEYTANQVAYKVIHRANDSVYVEDNRISQVVTTMDGRFNFENFSVYTESGIGSFLSNTYNAGLKKNAKPGVEHVSQYKRNWGETVFLEISTKRQLTYVPLTLSLYRISRHVVNNVSTVQNTSIEQAKSNAQVPDQYYTNYYDGMVTDVGMLANNRQGLNLFAFKDFFNKLKTKLSLGIAQEILNLAGDMRNGARANAIAGSNGADSLTRIPFANSITFEHRLNSVTRSRFGFYQRFTGPYKRLHSIFRHTYENIVITDTMVNYKKSFSTLQFELKYKFRLFGKEIIMTNFNNFSSVQDHWSAIPVFSNKAFLRYFYTEVMAFYAIHPKLTLVGFFGTERVLGNNRTDLADANGNLITDKKGRPVADPNGKPINETGYGFGPGLDYNFTSNASLNIRQRWFSQSDKNFIRDQFKGNEMTIEFKVFF